ncbi:MAG: hypothetical protein ACP5O1_10020 [Phycisphaerae bacterium]
MRYFRNYQTNGILSAALMAGLLIGASAGIVDAAPRISESMLRAIHQLGSSRYTARQKAEAEIRALLADQLRATIAATGDERRARLIHILEFDENISRWALAVMRRPASDRRELFNWGLSPQVAPLIADAFSHRPSVQIKAVGGLAALWPRSEWIVDRLLSSPHRLVYLSMLAAIWNIKPDAHLIDKLWRWSVASGNTVGVQNFSLHRLKFRHQIIAISHFVNIWQRIQDSTYATEVLRHWNPPQLKTLLTDYARTASIPNTPAAQTLASPSVAGCRNYLSLFARAHPRSAAPWLLKILHSPSPGGINFNFNNQQVHWDGHTAVVYLLILAAGKKPADYHFFHSQLYGGSWLTSTPAAQLQAQRRIVTWWHRHHVNSSSGVHPNPPTQLPPPVR